MSCHPIGCVFLGRSHYTESEMIRITQIGFLLLLVLGQCVACTSQSNGQTSPFTIPKATPGSQPTTVAPSVTGEPVDYVISDMPHCQGLTDLKAPVKFDWPDIENALEKLADYNWGYYTCAIPQPQLLSLLRDGMPKPPYLWREVNHADHAGGTVVLFYRSFKIIWIYIWVLPGPDTQTSYMFIAKGYPGVPQTWECRLLLPGTQNPASLTSRGPAG